MDVEKPSVCCVMPCRNIPHPEAFKSLQLAAFTYRAALSTPAREPREKNRNMSVQAFLDHENPKFDYLLFVDDDTCIPRDAIARMLAHDKDIVTGIQPLYMRNEIVANVMRFPTEECTRPAWPDWLTWEAPEKPFLVRFCGFGCVLIKRHVFEKIEWPWFVEDYGNRRGENHTTEDIYFCNKAYRAGFDIWCDATILCGHMKTVDLCMMVPIHRVDLNVGVTGVGEDVQDESAAVSAA